jgi:hypothetical protein
MVYMKNAVQIRTYWNIPGLVTLSIAVLFMIPHTHANSLKNLQADLPQHAGAWSVKSDDRIFDQKTIFSYINGAAEVYKAYNFRQCLSRRYSLSGGPAIILDIFDMGSSQDAFGVFTHDLDGMKVDIGREGRLRPGWLSFWKARFFVSIYVEEESPAAERAVKALGLEVAEKISGASAKPEFLSRLPSEGLLANTIRYLHHPIVLNYHYYLADENILHIAADTDVALAEYQRGRQNARLLLVKYPTGEKAGQSRAAFLKHYLPDADKQGAALLENGKWAAVKTTGYLLTIVLEADNRQFAEQLLEEVSKLQ